MSGFWDLFAETGEIGFYLMYLESTEENVSSEECGAIETEANNNLI